MGPSIGDRDLLARFIAGVTDYAIYTLDPTGVVMSWNGAAETIKGYSEEEAAGRSFHRFFTPEDQAAGVPDGILAEAARQGSAHREGWRVRKDGSRFWAMASVHAIRADDGALLGFGKIIRDMTEQRRAQLAVAESERRFRLLVDGVVDYALYMLDVDGVVVNWNQGAQRLKGYAPEEAVGRHFSQFYTPEDREAEMPLRALAQAQAAGRFESEGWRIRKDGSRFWALAILDAIYDEAGQHIGYAKITRDMTEQMLDRERLRESERRFRLLVEGVVDYSIFMLDPNGLISNWNQGAERIKGYRAEEVLGKHFSIFDPPDQRAAGAPARALETSVREGRFEAEGWRIRKDGSRFWASVVIDPIYDEDGAHIGFAKITRDVSERQAANQRLAESEREFRLLVSQLTDYALFMLDPSGIVANWNAGAGRIKGYAPDEIVGKHFSLFYTEVDRANGLPAQALEAARAVGRYEAEGWRVRRDGGLFWASVVIDAIRDEEGDLLGFAKVTRDITERREAQLQLQATNARLAQVQKMDALGQLTGGVAHDFNNLLMVVSGRAQMLRRKAKDRADILTDVEAIQAATDRGASLTRHLLTFARRQRLDPEGVSLAARVDPLRELLGASLSPGLMLEFDVPEDIWPVVVDVSEFEVALLNLVVNARDAMPDGGRIEVRAANRQLRAGKVQNLEGDFVEVAVRDAGAGIAPDVLSKVFDPFFTTKGAGKGTGLGLSQVYGFVEQAGGRVVVHSELGAGTTFTLYLPRGAVAPEVVQPAHARPAAGQLAILVVEDNPDVAEVACGLLEQLGHRTRRVSAAADALAVLQSDEPFDLVFSDVVMPGDMDGLQLARQVRNRWPQIPIVLATGYSQSLQTAAGEFPVLSKPYQLADLGRAVDDVLTGRNAEHANRRRRRDHAGPAADARAEEAATG